MPELHQRVVEPVAVVKPVKDESAFQGWSYKQDTLSVKQIYATPFNRTKTVTLDFGEHLTGYCTIHIRTANRTWDAPSRLRMTFGEVPAELNTPFDPWRGGLSRGWMQDQTVEILEDDMDTTITLRRRLSMRYLKIELLASSPGYEFAIDRVEFKAVSSAGELQTHLPSDMPQIYQDICRVATNTLRECMQTVYEDGPKRDHRLWIGDLYLEALANRYTFRQFQLTKRCLYLFAGLAREDGILQCNLFEYPQPHAQDSYMPSYNMLYIATLLDYLQDTRDVDTARDLWPLCRLQMEDVLSFVDDEGIFRTDKKPAWIFFDWRQGLDINACMQACTIDALQRMCILAGELGVEDQVAHYPRIAKQMKKAAREQMYDRKAGVVKSGPKGQVSVLSQTWMVRAGVLNAKEGSKAISTALSTDGVVMPGTPYATHYLIEAMLLCGMEQEACRYLTSYWGGMVRKGADTFWEAYDPEDDFLSPYNFFPVNSYCHAWSCTPVYFIHRYPEVFK